MNKMNSIPPNHSEQGNQATYCDMNYQLNHPFYRMDQHQHHHHQQQHRQQQLPLDTVRRGAIQNMGTTDGYGQHNQHQNYHSSSSDRRGIDRHIYEHQVPTSVYHQQHMFAQTQQLNSEPSTSLYHMSGGSGGNQGHDNMPFIPSQANYGSNIHNHMQQEPMQTTSQLYNNSMPFTRVAPQMHHHHNQQQHHEQYLYNESIVVQHQEQQQQHYQHIPLHHHHQENYLIQNQMPERMLGGQHHHQQQQQHHHPVIGVAESEYDNSGGKIIDQNQVFHQQEQMDSLPTIKQQQQLRQQHLQQQQQQLYLRQQNMGTSMGAAISTDTYGAQICSATGRTRQQPPPQQQEPVVNLMVSSLPPQHQPQPQTSQLVSRLQSDIASPVNTDINYDSQQQRLGTSQPQRTLSTTSYLNINNQLQPQPQPQPHRHHQHHHHQQQQQQKITSSINGNEPDSVPPNSSATRRGHQVEDFVDMRSCGSVSQDWLDTICRHLIDHMNRFGICVIDNFLGNLKGELILKEVQQLYNSGQHTRGMLVSSKLNTRPSIARDGSGGRTDEIGSASSAIRNDRVIWIDGYEDGCSEINNLIQTLCSVVTNSSRLSLYSNNGLDKIVINKRTKAHVACYPGNGTRYIKHVDNPNGDGRVITSIYYLNKDWNTKRDGGLLRMFPAGMDEVANIEPLFDRVLFFWSDRRNPHEVLPAYKDRFAITVWYIGGNRPA